MILKITISQDMGGKLISESCSIILDDAKHSPELQILDNIRSLKESVIKQCDQVITEILNKK